MFVYSFFISLAEESEEKNYICLRKNTLITMLDRTQAPVAYPIKNFSLLAAERFQLKNGIESYLMKGGSQPIVNLQLVLNLGKREETQKGQAYFMGKMMGEGTSTKSNQQISEYFESKGAYWGISTSSDWLELSVLCLNKHLGDILPVIIELLTDAVFPEKELETIKNITTQQYRVSREKNSYQASVLFKNKLFGAQHPYGYVLDEDLISKITRPLLHAFYQLIPQQQGGLLFIAGQLDERHLQIIHQNIERLNFEISLKPRNGIAELTPTIRYEKVYQEKADAMQSSIKIGRLLFDRKHDEQIAFNVLNTILGGYFGSRLMQNIREEKGLSYGIHSSVSFMKNRGIWMISSDVQKEKRELALVEIYKELERLKTEPVSDDELNLVKNYIAGSFVKAINSPTAMVNCHKSIQLYELPTNYFDEYIPKVWAVSAKQLQELANKYFTNQLLEVVVG